MFVYVCEGFAFASDKEVIEFPPIEAFGNHKSIYYGFLSSKESYYVKEVDEDHFRYKFEDFIVFTGKVFDIKTLAKELGDDLNGLLTLHMIHENMDKVEITPVLKVIV